MTELIIVIAIIAILAALLFPAAAYAKAQAKTAQCADNIHQIGLATLVYVNDFNDKWFPSLGISPNPGFAPQQTWFGYDNNNAPLDPGSQLYGDATRPATHPAQPGIIDPYVKSRDIFRCPSMPEQFQTTYATNGFTESVDPSKVAYYTTNPAAAQKEFGPANKTEQTVDPGFTISIPASTWEIQQPANTIVLWEHAYEGPLCNWLQAPDWFLQPPTDPGVMGHFALYHNNSSNTLWADGHTRKMAYGQLKRPYFSCRKDIYPAWK